MRNVFRCALPLAVLACYAGAPAAHADVIRVATVVAENEADFTANAALVPTFVALLKKAPAVKASFSGTDAGKLTIVTTSVWPEESAIKSVTDTAEWKAAAGKLKYKTYTAEVLQLVP
nr:hypothetical protein [uncultured Rhodopila sp.]